MNTTFEQILTYLTNKIAEVRSTVGSFTYMILSAVTFRLLDMESRFYALKQNMSVDTADDDAMDDLAKNRMIIRKQATVAIARGKFNIEIPEGSRFQVGQVVWVSGELIESDENYFYYVMTSEQTGSNVNKAIGQLTPITYIEGLNYAYIVEITIPAEDTETTESLRERYIASFNSKSFGGNKSSYKEYIANITGVGGCKVYPLKYGNGTVGITIIDSMYTVPSTELIENVQNAIDPDKNGDGEGKAPIGAIVTVLGVENQNIKIGLKCQFESGSFVDWESEIRTIINTYFHSKNETWADSSEVVIRRAEIISALLESDKIVDVLELTINDGNNNLILNEDRLAYLNELEEIA